MGSKDSGHRTCQSTDVGYPPAKSFLARGGLRLQGRPRSDKDTPPTLALSGPHSLYPLSHPDSPRGQRANHAVEVGLVDLGLRRDGSGSAERDGGGGSGETHRVRGCGVRRVVVRGGSGRSLRTGLLFGCVVWKEEPGRTASAVPARYVPLGATDSMCTISQGKLGAGSRSGQTRAASYLWGGRRRHARQPDYIDGAARGSACARRLGPRAQEERRADDAGQRPGQSEIHDRPCLLGPAYYFLTETTPVFPIVPRGWCSFCSQT